MSSLNKCYFRSSQCRSICNTLTVISSLSIYPQPTNILPTYPQPTQWNVNPNPVESTAINSSSSQWKTPCKPPNSPYAFNMGEFWWQHVFVFFAAILILFPISSSPLLVSMFEMFFVTRLKRNYELLTRPGLSRVKVKITSDRALCQLWPTLAFNEAKIGWKKASQKKAESAVRSATSRTSAYPAPTLLWALQPFRAVAQISFICSRVSVSRSFF